MDWASFADWGSLASIVGLPVAAVGLIVVGWKAIDARKAADQARDAVANVLTIRSGDRAATLIQELKNVLQQRQWEVGYHQCHTVRALIGDLKLTSLSTSQSASINEAVASLTRIEAALDKAIRHGGEPKGADSFNRSLSKIQNTLENILREAALARGGSDG